MKRLFFLALISVPYATFSQIKSYGTIRVMVFNYAHTDPAFGGLISFGGRGKIIGLGAGMGAISIPGATSPYIPVFGELSFFTNQRKVRPYFNMQAGYGIFQNNLPFGVNESGGFFFGSNLGVLLPMKGKMAFLLTAGYINSSFSVDAVRYTGKTTANSDGWSAGIGLKF